MIIETRCSGEKMIETWKYNYGWINKSQLFRTTHFLIISPCHFSCPTLRGISGTVVLERRCLSWRLRPTPLMNSWLMVKSPHELQRLPLGGSFWAAVTRREERLACNLVIIHPYTLTSRCSLGPLTGISLSTCVASCTKGRTVDINRLATWNCISWHFAWDLSPLVIVFFRCGRRSRMLMMGSCCAVYQPELSHRLLPSKCQMSSEGPLSVCAFIRAGTDFTFDIWQMTSECIYIYTQKITTF